MKKQLLDKIEELNFNLEENVISDQKIRHLAKALDLPILDTMRHLLLNGIWPLRFIRNQGILTQAQQAKLLDLKIFIAGLGGLGGYIASLLTRMGAANMRLCDPDVFDESNLNRQCFCTEESIGLSKVEAAFQGIMAIASYCNLEAIQISVNEENLPQLLTGMEIVIDCLDSVARKKMLEAAAARAGLAYLHGSVLGQDGFIYMANPNQTRLEALYPDIEAKNQTPGPNNVLATTVCGAAVLMLNLLLASITGNTNSQLLHADFSVPELETLII